MESFSPYRSFYFEFPETREEKLTTGVNYFLKDYVDFQCVVLWVIRGQFTGKVI